MKSRSLFALCMGLLLGAGACTGIWLSLTSFADDRELLGNVTTLGAAVIGGLIGGLGALLPGLLQAYVLGPIQEGKSRHARYVAWLEIIPVELAHIKTLVAGLRERLSQRSQIGERLSTEFINRARREIAGAHSASVVLFPALTSVLSGMESVNNLIENHDRILRDSKSSERMFHIADVGGIRSQLSELVLSIDSSCTLIESQKRELLGNEPKFPFERLLRERNQ